VGNGDAGESDMTRIYDDALHLMEVQGGSFVKSLANCYYAADLKNRAKLRETFAEYFDGYEARFAALSAEQKGNLT
jgi:hypothetical protein